MSIDVKYLLKRAFGLKKLKEELLAFIGQKSVFIISYTVRIMFGHVHSHVLIRLAPHLKTTGSLIVFERDTISIQQTFLFIRGRGATRDYIASSNPKFNGITQDLKNWRYMFLISTALKELLR